MRKEPLLVIVDLDNGISVPDKKVFSFIEEIINSNDQSVIIGSELLITGFRLAVSKKLIEASALTFKIEEREKTINEFGDLSSYHYEDVLRDFCRELILNRKTNKKD